MGLRSPPELPVAARLWTHHRALWLLATGTRTPRVLSPCALPTVNSDVEVELGIGGLDEGLQALGGIAALASQDIHHGPHLLGQGARLLHPASLLRREEVQPPQVADDLLQELW